MVSRHCWQWSCGPRGGAHLTGLCGDRANLATRHCKYTHSSAGKQLPLKTNRALAFGLFLLTFFLSPERKS